MYSGTYLNISEVEYSSTLKMMARSFSETRLQNITPDVTIIFRLFVFWIMYTILKLMSYLKFPFFFFFLFFLICLNPSSSSSFYVLTRATVHSFWKSLADSPAVRAGLYVKPPDVATGCQAGAQRNIIQFRCSVGGWINLLVWSQTAVRNMQLSYARQILCSFNSNQWGKK